MKLTTIEIKNYRSICHDYDADRSFTLRLCDGMNAIVGPNNTGKSNIFRAIALALDPKSPFDRALDMPAASTWAKPAVTLTFEVSNSGTEKTLLKHVDAYERKVTSSDKKTYASDGIVKLRATIEGADGAEGARRLVFVAKGAGARSLADDDPVAKKAIAQFQKCVQFVLVRSGDSLEHLLEGNFREMLRTVLREDLRKEYEAAEVSRGTYLDDLRNSLLQPLTARVAQELGEMFPEISDVQLDPDVRTLDEALALMRVDVKDLVSTDLANKGTGVRGGLIVAMLRHLAETGKRSIIFAVEEPESFLHPAAQECMRQDLEELVKPARVSLLVTTHSPHIVSRQPQSRVFAVTKDSKGQTLLRGEASGDEPHADLLSGLYSTKAVLDVLDRAQHVPDDVDAVLVVEGWTDARYIELALERAERSDLLERIAIVPAGTGLGDTGGAALAVMQALTTRAMSVAPVVAVFDNDADGSNAENMLRQIGTKTGYWTERKRVFSYRHAIAQGEKAFPYEAEDLWPNALLSTFVAADEENRLTAKRKRPAPLKGFSFDIKSTAKADLVVHLRDNVRKGDCGAWIQFIESILDACQVP